MTRIIKHTEERMHAEEKLVQQLVSVAKGESTWAEVEGMTFDDAKAIAQIGCDLAAAGRLEEARIVFEGLTTMNPKDSAARAALGTVYQKLGRIDDAVTEYSAAIKRDPKNPVALANRGEIRLKKGDRDGFADLALAVSADPHGETAAGRRARGLVKTITVMAAQAARSPKAANR